MGKNRKSHLGSCTYDPVPLCCNFLFFISFFYFVHFLYGVNMQGCRYDEADVDRADESGAKGNGSSDNARRQVRQTHGQAGRLLRHTSTYPEMRYFFYSTPIL